MTDTSSEVTTTNDAPLSINEAISAMTELDTTEEVPEDQPEVEEEQDEGEPPADDELPPDEEDEEDDGESGDDEDQAEDEDETEEDEEPEAGQGRFVADDARVRLADGTFTTVAELKAGSLKNADYTQKTQAHAEEKRQFQSEREQFTQTQQQTVQVRDYALAVLESLKLEPPSPELRKRDPMGYFDAVDDYNARVEQLNYFQQQKAFDAQEAEKQKQQENQERGRQEWAKLAEAVPQLKDQAKAAAYFGEIEAFAADLGITVPELQAEISQDHRKALILSDAAKWRKLQASKAKVNAKVEGRPPVQKGGKRLNPGQHKTRTKQAAIEKLNRSGTVKDATAAILALG